LFIELPFTDAYLCTVDFCSLTQISLPLRNQHRRETALNHDVQHLLSLQFHTLGAYWIQGWANSKVAGVDLNLLWISRFGRT
jgi:hypothetical protein